MAKKRSVGKAILFILILVALAAAIYFTFFFSYKCADIACFKAHQEKCSRTKFTNDAEDATWFYKVKGKENGRCEIYAEIINIKKGSRDKQKLEGKSMNCFLALGDTSSPESDLSKCHGLLREEMQELIIQKLHSYVIENLGEIGEELDVGI